MKGWAWRTVAIAATAALIGAAALAQHKDNPAPGATPSNDAQTCMSCHSSEMDGRKPVNTAGLASSPHRDLKCQDCHSGITAAPHTPAMLEQKAACGNCHTDQNAEYQKSSHAQHDRAPGDHPNCINCHGRGDPHAIQDAGKWPRERKVENCSRCHRQTERMERYRVDSDAVPSYEESFHGKALLRYGNLKVAICTDCHGHHGVLSPLDPAAPTHRNNAAATCAQKGCHPGAKVNFAMSGANHLRLKLKESPILSGEILFFRLLIFGAMLFLIGGVALDLRRQVMHTGKEPKPGRFIALLISLSFLFSSIALVLAVLGVPGVNWTAGAAAGLIVASVVLYSVRKKRNGGPKPEKTFERFNLTQRIQHALLALGFSTLVLTGMPLRFPKVEWLHSMVGLVGGLSVTRLVHRGAAIAMVVTGTWHLLHMLYRWWKAGFSLSALTMLPSKKDILDFIQVSKYYLGFSHEGPKYDRFQFREKMDYFAEYWGMPIMVLSGLVLWFPIYFGNRLPEVALSFAYIAHGYEATLAFLAILLWHMYNVHWNPEKFPMSPVWLTGTLTQSEMEEEHPLELERLERGTATPSRKPASAAAPLPSTPAERPV